jgi:hypothetical protein
MLVVAPRRGRTRRKRPHALQVVRVETDRARRLRQPRLYRPPVVHESEQSGTVEPSRTGSHLQRGVLVPLELQHRAVRRYYLRSCFPYSKQNETEEAKGGSGESRHCARRKGRSLRPRPFLRLRFFVLLLLAAHPPTGLGVGLAVRDERFREAVERERVVVVEERHRRDFPRPVPIRAGLSRPGVADVDRCRY